MGTSDGQGQLDKLSDGEEYMISTMARLGAAAAVTFGGALLLGAGANSIGGSEKVDLPAPRVDQAPSAAARDETIVFAGGCFWGVEAVFEHVRGVKSAVSGYAGGTMPSPSTRTSAPAPRATRNRCGWSSIRARCR